MSLPECVYPDVCRLKDETPLGNYCRSTVDCPSQRGINLYSKIRGKVLAVSLTKEDKAWQRGDKNLVRRYYNVVTEEEW